ncbi:MAG TPA: nucleotidyltransferase family protein [Candidatus Saccharimonadales bacterium]|jgi:mannose-1-phosphate guanylyltransferase|nr:nucleotidyltransferase family protein [Candidatus Saccharimonadales bacterium]
MKAMVLAAGLGTRLKPLTADRPKALVEIAGRTLLEITLTRLREAGVNDVIVNVHHFADMVVEYLRAKNNFGMRIEVSREDLLLETGGGLKKAAWFFPGNSATPPEAARPIEDQDQSFILHNVDVISNINLARMVQFHHGSQALATLAVQDRNSSRYLLFDRQGQLCGRRLSAQPPELVRTSQPLQALAFSGIHVVSPRLLAMMTEEGVFSIIDTYLRLAGQGENILAFQEDESYWRDLGTPESVMQAELDVRNRVIQ